MKKVVIPVLVLFGLMIGAIVFFVSVRFLQVQYEKGTQSHFGALAQGELTASCEGQTVLVSDNWGRAQWLFTIAGRKSLLLEPDVSMDGAVVFSLSDGAEYTVIR